MFLRYYLVTGKDNGTLEWKLSILALNEVNAAHTAVYIRIQRGRNAIEITNIQLDPEPNLWR